MKTVKTRDSATSILRKIGVNSREYGLFITRNENGTFTIDDAAAFKFVCKEVVIDLVAKKDVILQPASPPAPVARPVVVPKDPPKPTVEKLSISGMAEQLLLAGKTNAETWSALKEKFKLGDDKKHYPSWFRSRLRRQGRLAKKEKKS